MFLLLPFLSTLGNLYSVLGEKMDYRPTVWQGRRKAAFVLNVVMCMEILELYHEGAGINI